MNKKGNQRYQETCQKIEGAVIELLKEKKAEQVTVSEICRRAQVHRTTFYGHYTDIPDLMNHVAGQMYSHVMEGFKLADDATSGEGFIKLFCYIRENQQMFRSLMDYYSSRRYEFDILPSKMEQHVKKLMKKSGFEGEVDSLYYYIFFTEGLKAVIYHWLERGCTETPEEMWRIVSKEYEPLRKEKIQKKKEKRGGSDLY